jgi:diguanylate cyclase (GGDEF)-like protein
MDVEMPEKSGMEWLKEIVQKELAPVVMLTGHGNEEIAVQAIQIGAVGYLPKSGLSAVKLLNAVECALIKWRELKLIRANEEQLARMANIDHLTGLYNRRAALSRLDELFKQARRYVEKLSVIMLDIDHFKMINDRYGHLTGDETLEKIAVLLQNRIRDADTVGRYGGEEFLIILPKADIPSAMRMAERIRKTIAAAKIRDRQGNVFSITVSQGLAGYKPGDDTYSIVSRADNALYWAKVGGRNRVETCELIAQRT